MKKPTKKPSLKIDMMLMKAMPGVGIPPKKGSSTGKKSGMKKGKC